MKTPAEGSTGSVGGADQRAAALEVVRRHALLTGRAPRDVLSMVRLSDPPTQSEELLLAAVRLLGSPHMIVPHPCETAEEWVARYAPESAP